MFTVNAIIFFVLGLVIGSFLNVLIYRVDELSTIFYTRSHCRNCKRLLQWNDLIPFISFILLKAKCRYCGSKISMQYPLVELFTGLLFLLFYLTMGFSLGMVIYLIIFSILIVVFVYDLKTQMVPEIFVWIAFGLSLLFGWYAGAISFGSSILGGLVVGGLIAIIVAFSKEQWMGKGDIKIGAILGLLTGFPTAFFALFLAGLLGSVTGILYVWIRNKALTRQSLKVSIPFAPFLITSALIVVLYGRILIDLYISRFSI